MIDGCSKGDVLEELKESKLLHWNKGAVTELVKKINTLAGNSPKYIKKGDVFMDGVRSKKRPYVVIKVLGDICLSIPLSTCEDEINLYPSKSRYWLDGWFSKSIMSVKSSYVMSFHVGVYDNDKRLQKAIDCMMEFLIKALK